MWQELWTIVPGAVGLIESALNLRDHVLKRGVMTVREDDIQSRSAPTPETVVVVVRGHSDPISLVSNRRQLASPQLAIDGHAQQ